MRLLESLIAACLCLAQVSIAVPVAFTYWPSTIKSGQPANVTWSGDDDVDTTITLRKGEAHDLGHVQVLTDNARGGIFTFVPDDSLPAGSDYALEIRQKGQVNYSGHITLESSDTVIPPSKGPRPSSDNPDSPDFETATHDQLGEDVREGNDGHTVSKNATSTTSGNNLTSHKSAMAAQMQASGASLRNTYPELVLGAAAFVLYLTR
ncbi:hypothetical protein EYZ11_002009 [Aspergillus tanneri]|uniref:Yeast cell wall synthesis Kre9/Knh1-like N-terminal domain-containing protein n=1 Tax=Aspergillus tanneri TaxID=1220188 RepID=A0A4S3JU72_9EURO|nr:uncharacterized protein ATNIH1004_004361 [Aspergillus tanneri]KAA8648476.1 hypothetical protein ATNIH1004_004361 [Aspergillus tanneri]THC98501.1 hypothetical protein EYZ11_002009 [Aspergillus tanneri]